jgi:23S rRNA pseudouridine1911/1915/1917 synthase
MKGSSIDQEPMTNDQDPMTLLPSRILFEDNHLIIVNKLPSEIVQGDKTGDLPLSENVKEYIRDKYGKPGNVFLGVVHRLDRPVSGAVIFAKTGKALSRMNELLKSRDIRKIYWVVVGKRSSVVSRQSSVGSQQSAVERYAEGGERNPDERSDIGIGSLQSVKESQRLAVSGQQSAEGIHLVHYLRRNEQKNVSYAYPDERRGTQKAELIYRIIADSERYHLLEVELLTGRHHQIRAQLAAIGFPVKGDLKYGYPRSNPDGSIHLHSRRVEFIHPVRKEMINIIADPPKERLWDYFLGALKGV